MGDLKECVTTCDTNEYREVDRDKTYCYVDACPEGTYAKSITEKECVSTCDSGFYKVDGNNSICADVCDTTQFAEIPKAN